MKNVTVYGKNNCPACEQAKSLLKQEGVEFTFINCDEDFDAFDKMVQEGRRSFPQVYLGGCVLEGGWGTLKQMYDAEGNLDFLK